MRIAVVGDTLLDRDIEGRATRLSPDGAAPVVEVSAERRRPGGAGLVARLLAGDGRHEVTLVTALGEDERARELRAALEDVEIVAAASGVPTPLKTRLRVGDGTLGRLDEDCAPPPPAEVTLAMADALAGADAVIVADYGRGLIEHPLLREALRSYGRGPLVWDPHPRGPAPAPSATIATPNASEAGLDPHARPDQAAGVSRELRSRWGCAAVAVTLGAHGAVVATDGAHGSAAGPYFVAAPAVHAPDSCGAGDRFAASLATALLEGSAVPAAVQAAVHEAASFLAAGGVARLDDPPEPAPAPLRIADGAAEALELVRRVQARGGTVVATGGCFDLVHAGHVRMLAAARALGDCLVVCLNSDASVRRLKGPERPIIGQADRRELLLAMQCVDAVAVFDEDTPEAVLRRLRPDAWVKGGDYAMEQLPEAELVRSWGGRCLLLPYEPARSTTRLAGALARVG